MRSNATTFFAVFCLSVVLIYGITVADTRQARVERLDYGYDEYLDQNIDVVVIAELAGDWLKQPGDKMDLTIQGQRYLVVWPSEKSSCDQDTLDRMCNAIGRAAGEISADQCAPGRFGGRSWRAFGAGGCTCTNGVKITVKECE